MLVVREAYRNGLFSGKNCFANILPGIVVGVVALPLAMAFSIASGVAPECGLYTSIVAGFFVSVMGGSRVQIAGPTGAFVAILYTISHKYGLDGLRLATFLASVFLVFMGTFKLGSIIKYIPEPVIVGFTSGVAITIWVGQWKDFFGLDVCFSGADLGSKLMDLFKAFGTIDLTTTLLSVISLLLIVFTNRYLKPLPGFLMALVVAVNIGVMLATLLFMRRMAKTVQIENNTIAELHHEQINVDIPQNVSIYSIEGPFFFGAIDTFQSALSIVNSSVHTIIIRLKHVPFIDVSAIDSLRSFKTTLASKSIQVLFCEANDLVYKRMLKARLEDDSKDNKFDRTLEQVLQLTR